MPSGKTHDAVTIILAVPVITVVMLFTQNVWSVAAVGSAFLFGGLMFGPDLDTQSTQFSRWWIFKPFWLPYRICFRHRSRWTHGIVFGSLFRIIYFMGLLTLGSFAAAYITATYAGGSMPGIHAFLGAWGRAGNAARALFGEHVLLAIFAGLWLGAASHTMTDIAGTYIKTGRPARFF
jgi:uncharacterized metal-binding protein